MDQNTLLVVLVAAAAIGLIAAALILRRRGIEENEATRESEFGVSTEGEKICPHCGGQNLWTEATCIYCHSPLKG